MRCGSLRAGMDQQVARRTRPRSRSRAACCSSPGVPWRSGFCPLLAPDRRGDGRRAGVRPDRRFLRRDSRAARRPCRRSATAPAVGIAAAVAATVAWSLSSSGLASTRTAPARACCSRVHIQARLLLVLLRRLSGRHRGCAVPGARWAEPLRSSGSTSSRSSWEEWPRLSVQRRVYKVRLKRRSNDSIHTDWRERIERGGRTRRGACPHVHRPKRAVGLLGRTAPDRSDRSKSESK